MSNVPSIGANIVKRLVALLLVTFFALAGAQVRAEESKAPQPAEASPRIVSLGASVTETLAALGVQDEIVAVDESSTHPPELARLPRVGYHRQVAAEGILSLNPTLVIGAPEAGPETALEQLRASGVKLEVLTGNHTLASACEQITTIGKLVHKEQEANALVARIGEQLEEVDMRTRRTNKPRVLFIYARGGGTMNVAGHNTKADELIRLAGGTNAAGELEGYKPLTSESVVTANPDVLLLLDGGLAALGGEEAVLALPGVSLTNAGKNRRLVHLDDGLALSFGPRAGDGVVALARALHPNEMKAAE